MLASRSVLSAFSFAVPLACPFFDVLAQSGNTPGADAFVEDAFYRCLKAQFPGTERDISDHKRAFDPDTGRNFAYDGKAWIDAKTGESTCPKVASSLHVKQPVETPTTPGTPPPLPAGKTTPKAPPGGSGTPGTSTTTPAPARTTCPACADKLQSPMHWESTLADLENRGSFAGPGREGERLRYIIQAAEDNV